MSKHEAKVVPIAQQVMFAISTGHTAISDCELELIELESVLIITIITIMTVSLLHHGSTSFVICRL